jgi:hypothetical protein
MKCLFVVNRICIGKHPEDSNLESSEAIQGVVLYLPICHDTAQLKCSRTPSCMYTNGKYFSSFGRECKRKSL